ncbi:hypothetical protein PAHAL_7G023200 [Panicum hallii]|jgi:hypothetical protein|uniref:Uncharacterized protein n=1 Tax=Panicum hallii TaxID=206008 RepID=A0A2T8IAQ4_9POAL|nr:hypothetical protein PAHAL_7G023200 [Panicum hallii]
MHKFCHTDNTCRNKCTDSITCEETNEKPQRKNQSQQLISEREMHTLRTIAKKVSKARDVLRNMNTKETSSPKHFWQEILR